MNPVIEIKNIGKRYNITHQKGGYVTLRDILTNIIKSPFRFLKTKVKKITGFETKEEFWALKNVSFTVQKGEVIGIIGPNGAGKSTLLKILSQITPPTEGEIKIRGRVGSLLEVGTGFHPELSGRENIFLNGAILGMTKKEVVKKFDEIVEFSGIGKFLDTPVKYYSSGMYVRLAFSVAAHMEPDILIVDEVLAVGDAEFQKKCLGKMEEITRGEGRTIIFVSHNMSAIRDLCQKTILLQNGKIIRIGKTEEVIDYYLNNDKINAGSFKIWNNGNYPGDENVAFHSIRTLNENHKPMDTTFAENQILIEIEYEIIKPIKNLQMVLEIKNEEQIIFESGDFILPKEKEKIREKGLYASVCTIPAYFLNQANYSLSLSAHIPNQKILFQEKNVIRLSVLTKTSLNGTEFQPGFLRPIFDWQIIKK